jgi:imidazolonepropionase-like amidohydrolase
VNGYKEIHLPEESIEKERMIGQLQRDNFAKCVKAGVKMAYGTDAGVYLGEVPPDPDHFTSNEEDITSVNS